MIHGRKFSKVWGQGVPRNGGREGGGLAISHKLVKEGLKSNGSFEQKPKK